ncbi:MAG: paraquat-inducible protein A [Planctomycetes bacterium]|nr:paraquat-inducible protein A [Planctomycetota bacterium]
MPRASRRRPSTVMITLTRYLYYPLAVALAALVVIEAGEAERLAQAAAEMQSLAGSTRLAWAELLERLSLSLYSGASDLKQAYGALIGASRDAAGQVEHGALAFAVLSLLQLAWVAWSARGRSRVFAWHLNLVALVAFAVGIAAPMLTVVAYADVPVLGEVVLRYEAKSIVGTVLQLGSLGSWFTALLLTLFSIVTPFVKLLLSWVAASTRDPRRVVSAIEHIGKWSMTDVFVVAVLLAFLAAGPGGMTRASLGVGLYFFAGYAIASQVAGHLLVHALRGRTTSGEQA